MYRFNFFRIMLYNSNVVAKNKENRTFILAHEWLNINFRG